MMIKQLLGEQIIILLQVEMLNIQLKFVQTIGMEKVLGSYGDLIVALVPVVSIYQIYNFLVQPMNVCQ